MGIFGPSRSGLGRAPGPELKSESRSRRFRAQRRHFTTSPIDASAAIATVLYHTQCDTVAAVIPSADAGSPRLRGYPSGFLQSV